LETFVLSTSQMPFSRVHDNVTICVRASTPTIREVAALILSTVDVSVAVASSMIVRLTKEA
jgi:hypothetical protein